MSEGVREGGREGGRDRERKREREGERKGERKGGREGEREGEGGVRIKREVYISERKIPLSPPTFLHHADHNHRPALSSSPYLQSTSSTTSSGQEEPAQS